MVPFERAFVTSYRPSIVTFPLSYLQIGLIRRMNDNWFQMELKLEPHLRDLHVRSAYTIQASLFRLIKLPKFCSDFAFSGDLE